MALALFDLDGTLIAGDSDYEWGCYLVSIGKVDGEAYAKKNERFYKEYVKGELDIYEFLNFSFKPLAENSYEELCQWRDEYLHSRIKPIVKAKASELIEKHRSAGDHLALITATSNFITEPIKNMLNLETLIATEPEISNGNFTGNVKGTPCFGSGKVTRIKQWINTTAYTLEGSYFYSDSHNDIPLLELVDHPTAVDADAALTTHAIKNNWSRLSLK
jgi:HAD superfamily hydrolase (TIGR01490 family)